MKKINLLLIPLLITGCTSESKYDYELFNKVVNYMIDTNSIYQNYNEQLFNVSGTYKEENNKYLITLEFYNPVKTFENIRLIAMSSSVIDNKSNEYACMGFDLTRQINFTSESLSSYEIDCKEKLTLYWYTTEEVVGDAKIYFSYEEDGSRYGLYFKQSLYSNI